MIAWLYLLLFVASAPLAASEPVRVLVFTTTDCPISNRYAPEIQRLAAKFSGRATFVLVYPVAADSPDVIREHHKRFGYSLESIRDIKHELVRQTGVTVTPEVAVMAGARIVYRGRIDDRYIELGKDRVKPTRHDLEDALTAVLANKPVAQKETRAIGCFLPDLIK
jgi:peptidoglycan/xylan/chitin deacetylase (PgdA/CDA1 family)